ncbi:IS66 family transposase [Bacteroides thetaiotaomicron]|nr:IS66 family transposase [Bacteroides thetaiotaomicron]
MKNFKGYLQSDGHPIYDAFEDGEDVCLCGCLAHIRRHIEPVQGRKSGICHAGTQIYPGYV